MIIDSELKKRLKKHLLEKIKEEQKARIIIETPFKLSLDELNRIGKLFDEDKSKELINEIKKDLIGGVIIKYGSKIIDASIKSRIDEVVLNISK